jgi:hypothetical protein
MEWLNTLSDIGLPTVITVIICIIGLSIFVIKGIEALIKWSKSKFLYFYNKKVEAEKLHETIKDHSAEIDIMEKSQFALSNGMQILLKENLKALHKEYVDNGHISSDELEDYEFQYNTYHSLGGNGTGTRYFEDVKKLPIKD